MPNYPFPSSEDLIKEVLDNLSARRQMQTQTPTQTTESQGKNAMDSATIDGLKQNGANIPEQQPVLDGLARRYAGDILGSKMAYATAQNDAQRQAASLNANMLRQAAQGAGMDLSGYGSDVSLQDAMQNLQTNDARA